MKTYSIGRDLNCDIVINDSTDVISRRHALLNVTSFGKMTIIDQSSNGTYVNGIRISQNVPVPITRKDIISLAHVAKLDWNQVPKTNLWIMPVIAAIVLVIVLVVYWVIKESKSNIDINPDSRRIQTEQIDSTLIKQKEKARLDSLKTVSRQDSIRKATEQVRRDSIENAKKNKVRKDTTKQKKEEEAKEKAKEETNKKPKPRPLG